MCKEWQQLAFCFWFPHAAKCPNITTHPQELKDFPLGKHAAFHIKATGTKPLRYQWWYKKGRRDREQQLRNGEDFQGVDSSTLTISHVKATNKGSYYCTVENDGGKKISECATLTIGELHCCVNNVSMVLKVVVLQQ